MHLVILFLKPLLSRTVHFFLPDIVIEEPESCVCFVFFLVTPRGMWDLSSLIGD